MIIAEKSFFCAWLGFALNAASYAIKMSPKLSLPRSPFLSNFC
jgi:hypothetical protein